MQSPKKKRGTHCNHLALFRTHCAQWQQPYAGHTHTGNRNLVHAHACTLTHKSERTGKRRESESQVQAQKTATARKRGREGGNVTARLVAQFSFSPAPSNSFLAALSRLSPSRSRSAREIWSSMTCCTRKPWQFYSSLSARICNNVHAKLSKFPQNIKNHKASEKLKEKR